MVNLVREHRAGRLELFTPPRKPGPPPGAAPAKDRARGRVIELRRQGLSTYEISARLADEGTPLNRTSVAEILSEEGFGRLLRHPAAQASTAAATPGRDTRLPKTAALDFATWPHRVDSAKAGLLLLIPDLVALDLPALVKTAGYPGTRIVPATSWLLSLLALKLTRTRRVSHVDDLLLTDPAAALLAGLATLPKKSALTNYSYRTGHDHQRAFLAALDTKMIAGGLATADQAIFDLDCHAEQQHRVRVAAQRLDRPLPRPPQDDPLTWPGDRPGRAAAIAPATTAEAIELVAAGVGLLVVPQSLARLHHRRDLTHRPLADAPGSGVGLAWPDTENTELMEEFIGIVRGRTANSSRTPRRDGTPAPGTPAPTKKNVARRPPARRGTHRR